MLHNELGHVTGRELARTGKRYQQIVCGIAGDYITSKMGNSRCPVITEGWHIDDTHALGQRDHIAGGRSDPPYLPLLSHGHLLARLLLSLMGTLNESLFSQRSKFHGVVYAPRSMR